MPAPAACDYGSSNPVQHDVTIKRVFYVIARNDEDRSTKLWDVRLPLPAQVDDLLFAKAGIDLEERHRSQVTLKLREQQALFRDRKRVGLARVRMTLHLDERCDWKPRPIGFVAPQARRQIQDPSHDGKISVDRVRPQALVEPEADVRCKRVVMHPLQRQAADERIEKPKRPLVALETSLVLVLGEEFGRGFAQRGFAWVTEEMDLPSLSDASREQRLSLGEVSGTGTLADSLAVDDLVDVPDAASEEESGRSS